MVKCRACSIKQDSWQVVHISQVEDVIACLLHTIILQRSLGQVEFIEVCRFVPCSQSRLPRDRTQLQREIHSFGMRYTAVKDEAVQSSIDNVVYSLRQQLQAPTSQSKPTPQQLQDLSPRKPQPMVALLSVAFRKKQETKRKFPLFGKKVTYVDWEKWLLPVFIVKDPIDSGQGKSDEDLKSSQGQRRSSMTDVISSTHQREEKPSSGASNDGVLSGTPANPPDSCCVR